ncbi:MAG: restriction endonuclease subunit S [Kiritimatiellae bacterium]|nr:restriction endonuclease subunit S [Kiritimatiellia bacterium]
MTEYSHILVSELVASGEAELKTGPFGTQLKASEYTEDGTPVINVRNIGMGSIKPDKLEFISITTRDRLSSHLLRCGDIVFGRKGAVERHVFIRKEQDGWFQGSDCLRLRLNSPRVEPLFASYFFITEEHQRWMKNQCSHGATMASLNQGILERIELPIPPLAEQQRIVGILSAYDELIENSQRRIQILEKMARALYREWFVHFKFLGHEKVKTIDGVPEGWEVSTLGNLVEIKKGKNITKSTIRPGAVPVVAGGLNPAYYHDTPNTEQPVITISASGANAGFVNLYYVNVWASDCSFVDLVTTPHVYYFYLWLKHHQKEVTHLQRGAAQPHVYPKDLLRLEALNVPETILKMFNEKVTPAFKLIKKLTAKIENLQRTRDLLLPRLLSGKINLGEN